MKGADQRGYVVEPRTEQSSTATVSLPLDAAAGLTYGGDHDKGETLPL